MSLPHPATTLPRTRRRLRAALATLVMFASTMLASAARAQARVVAEVRAEQGPAEGQVVLEAVGEARRFTCETQGGACTMEGVPGGRYIVSFVPRGGGEGPAPRPVVVPPEGRVTLRVSAR